MLMELKYYLFKTKDIHDYCQFLRINIRCNAHINKVLNKFFVVMVKRYLCGANNALDTIVVQDNIKAIQKEPKKYRIDCLNFGVGVDIENT